MPNTPIASTAKSIPSCRSTNPRVRRSWPVSISWPTVESSNPNTTMMQALSTEPRASTMASPRPNTIKPKYSAGPNSSASLVSGAPIAAMTSVATVPAKNEAMAAIPNAIPAWPLRAMAWPSSVVTTDVASPGMLTRIAVVEPPYWAP